MENTLARLRLLVVDDEAQPASMVADILHMAGYTRVDTANDAASALAAIKQADRAADPYKLFVFDVMMPDMDGFDLLSCVRALPAHAKTPALFLTARDAPTDRIQGLSLGADDYVSKPFLPQELTLRVNAILRRCYPQTSQALVLDVCTVDLASAEATRADGAKCQLTAKELELLEVLARNAGRIVTIDAICEALWGSTFAYENSLMAHVRRLREKIEADPSHPVSLVTVRGLGYKLVTKG